MNLVLPVLVLLFAVALFARVAAFVQDMLHDIWEHSWHPAKLAVRVSTLTLGLSFLAVLGYFIWWLGCLIPAL